MGLSLVPHGTNDEVTYKHFFEICYYIVLLREMMFGAHNSGSPPCTWNAVKYGDFATMDSNLIRGRWRYCLAVVSTSLTSDQLRAVLCLIKEKRQNGDRGAG